MNFHFASRSHSASNSHHSSRRGRAQEAALKARLSFMMPTFLKAMDEWAEDKSVSKCLELTPSEKFCSAL
jgi:hypothetical protein